jgi:hypothetical protein
LLIKQTLGEKREVIDGRKLMIRATLAATVDVLFAKRDNLIGFYYQHAGNLPESLGSEAGFSTLYLTIGPKRDTYGFGHGLLLDAAQFAQLADFLMVVHDKGGLGCKKPVQKCEPQVQ